MSDLQVCVSCKGRENGIAAGQHAYSCSRWAMVICKRNRAASTRRYGLPSFGAHPRAMAGHRTPLTCMFANESHLGRCDQWLRRNGAMHQRGGCRHLRPCRPSGPMCRWPFAVGALPDVYPSPPVQRERRYRLTFVTFQAPLSGQFDYPPSQVDVLPERCGPPEHGVLGGLPVLFIGTASELDGIDPFGVIIGVDGSELGPPRAQFL